MRRILKRVVFAISLMLFAAAAYAGPAQYRLDVKGLACPFCAYGIEKQLRSVEGVTTVETHIKEGAVVVRMAEGAKLDKATARQAVQAAGFTLGGFRQTGGTE